MSAYIEEGIPSTTASAPLAQSVTSTASTILAANISRIKFIITNTGVVPVYLCFNGQTPTSTNYHVALSACTVANNGTGGTIIDSNARGAVQAITASTSGSVTVTEFTA